MKIKPFSRHATADALSWLLTGAMVLLVMLFSVMIVRDYGRETTAARQTIEEKGSVLIRALESGTRVGMGMRMHHAQLQALLEEMAWQPGVLWFAVTDENGKIIAHSDPQQVDNALYSPAQMRELHVSEQARWRRLNEPQPALEIYRQFRPLNPARGHHMGMMNRGNSALAQPTVPQVIFIAFDSRELDAAQARGQRNMMIMLGAAYSLTIAAILSEWIGARRLESTEKESAAGNPEPTTAHPSSGDLTGEHVSRAIAVRCEDIAVANKLSPRETEIFILLAQGRTRTLIQEELVLAENTVKTHIAHIYAKLGIGNRQEMMDLVLGATEEDGRAASPRSYITKK